MRWVLAPFRFIGLLTVLLSGVLFSAVGSFWLSDPIRRRRFQTRVYHFCSPWILRMVGGRVTVVGKFPDGPALIVCNHLSDMDVIALHPVVFITSMEIRQDPVSGAIARLGGSYFVERRQVIRLKNELQGLKELFRQRFTVVLFAEATSSNGEGVLAFRNALFAPAIEAEVFLQPVCLQYQRIGGEPVTPLNRDRVFYYDTMGFGRHLLNLVSSGGFELECRYLPSRMLQKSEDRKDVCGETFNAVSGVYRRVSSRPSQ